MKISLLLDLPFDEGFERSCLSSERVFSNGLCPYYSEEDGSLGQCILFRCPLPRRFGKCDKCYRIFQEKFTHEKRSLPPGNRVPLRQLRARSMPHLPDPPLVYALPHKPASGPL